MALYAFDGTWNENEKQEETTNVVRFSEVFKKQSVQVAEYTEGVGTRFGVLGHILGGLFGSGGRSRIHEMYDELKDNWQQGDHVIDIIGFSRGAALAVHFSNVLTHCGLKLDDKSIVNPKIRFLGVWDIVGSFGIPINLVIKFQDINLHWNIDEIPETVENFYHAIALNERREAFNVTRPVILGDATHFEELWFKGVHSDVGGGNNNLLRSNIALQWLLEKAIESGLPINPDDVINIKIQTQPPARIRNNLDPQRDARREFKVGDKLHKTSVARELVNVGDSADFWVYAADLYSWSGVQLKKGQTYQFEIAADEQWQDASIVCDALGWVSSDLPWYQESVVKHLEDNRRVPDANWFELCGSLEDEEDYFRIGRGGGDNQYIAPRDAELYAFANDLLEKYGNNKGRIRVTIKRIA